MTVEKAIYLYKRRLLCLTVHAYCFKKHKNCIDCELHDNIEDIIEMGEVLNREFGHSKDEGDCCRSQ